MDLEAMLRDCLKMIQRISYYTFIMHLKKIRFVKKALLFDTLMYNFIMFLFPEQQVHSTFYLIFILHTDLINKCPFIQCPYKFVTFNFSLPYSPSLQPNSYPIKKNFNQFNVSLIKYLKT